MKTVAEMMSRLEQHPAVTGLLVYGSDHAEEGYRTGDVDLFVVLRGGEPPVESLHFDVASTPVDLNLITLGALSKLRPAFSFPALALRDGAVVFDRTGDVGDALARLREGFSSLRPEAPSEHAVALVRHGHRHVLDKVRGRLEAEPLLANLLLGANVYWLVQSYLRLRRLPFSGERQALDAIREHDAPMYGLLEAFYEADGLAERARLSERLTAHALRPVGGAWRRGEVLAFAVSEEKTGGEPLASSARQVYRELFGEEPVSGSSR